VNFRPSTAAQKTIDKHNPGERASVHEPSRDTTPPMANRGPKATLEGLRDLLVAQGCTLDALPDRITENLKPLFGSLGDRIIEAIKKGPDPSPDAGARAVLPAPPEIPRHSLGLW
jgi:hypothetical protein